MMEDRTSLPTQITGLLLATFGYTLYYFTKSDVWLAFGIGGNVFQVISIIIIVK